MSKLNIHTAGCVQKVVGRAVLEDGSTRIIDAVTHQRELLQKVLVVLLRPRKRVRLLF